MLTEKETEFDPENLELEKKVNSSFPKREIEKRIEKEVPFDQVPFEINYSNLPKVDESELKRFLLEFVEGIDSVYYEGDKLIWHNKGDKRGIIELINKKGEHVYAWSHENILRKFIMDYLGVKDDEENE